MIDQKAIARKAPERLLAAVERLSPGENLGILGPASLGVIVSVIAYLCLGGAV